MGARDNPLLAGHISVTRIFGHRGSSGEAPENTLAAFRRALETGADGVELDLHGSRDGHPVVIHDPTLDRTTNGKGPVVEAPLKELRKLDAGAWFAPEFAGEVLPEFGEVLKLFRPTTATLCVELKAGERAFPGWLERALRMIQGAAIETRVILSSFHLETMAEIRLRAPALTCALLVRSESAQPWLAAERLGMQGLHPPAATCDERLMHECGARDLAVRPFTVNSEDEAARLFALGVEAIITDFPARLLAARETWLKTHRPAGG